MKKKLLLTSAVMVLLTSAAAYANEFNLDVNLGAPAIVAPAYIAPAPAIIVNPYVPQSYDPHHRAHDWRYWQDRRAHGHDDHWDHR